MMIELLQKRRSIRRFENRPVEPEKIAVLSEALLRSPTSRGRNPWEFILVTDAGLLSRIALAKEHGSGFLAQAPLAVAVCADTRKSDVWVEDCSIAAIIVQLTAASIGLGSCWAQIRSRMHDQNRTSEEYLREVLGLPDPYAVEAIIGIGYPGEKMPGHSEESLEWSRIHRNRFSS